MVEENNSNGLDRRTVLQSASMAGLSIAGLSGGVGATEGDRNVEKIEGHEKQQILFNVIFSEEVRRLQDHIGRPIYPELRTSSVFRVKNSDDTGDGKSQYRVATINFSQRKKRQSSKKESLSIFLTWNDKDDTAVPRSVFTIVDGESKTQTRLFLKKGQVIEEEANLGDGNENAKDIVTTSDVTIRSSVDAEECVDYISDECTNVNWSCVAQLGLGYAGCGLAVAGGQWAGVILCLLEGGVWLWQVADKENCSVCDSSELREVEVCGPPSSSGPGSP